MSVYELEVAIASGIIIPTVAIAVSIFLAYRPEKIPFRFLRYDSLVEKPFESKTALEVSHPDKTIEKCRVIYDGQALICEESKLHHTTIFAQGSALFRIPLNIENEEAKVIVKNGRHTIRKERFKDIERRGEVQASHGRGFVFWSRYGKN
jgi:hypothetical protein